MKYQIVFILIVMLIASCSPFQKDVDLPSEVIDRITLTVIRNDVNKPLTGAGVVLTGEEGIGVSGTTNSNGVVIFRQVDASHYKMHCYIQGEDENQKPYLWDSKEEGYSGGIDFYQNPSMTIRVDPLW